MDMIVNTIKWLQYFEPRVRVELIEEIKTLQEEGQ